MPKYALYINFDWGVCNICQMIRLIHRYLEAPLYLTMRVASEISVISVFEIPGLCQTRVSGTREILRPGTRVWNRV